MNNTRCLGNTRKQTLAGTMLGDLITVIQDTKEIIESTNRIKKVKLKYKCIINNAEKSKITTQKDYS